MTGTAKTERGPVRVGADRIVTDAAQLITGRRIGILTNHTGRLSDGTYLTDALVESGVGGVVALFGPEHGLLGNVPDGTVVDHAKHQRYDIPVYSLYGHTHKPTPAMLSDIDVLVCDIQDVGARFYTYSTTVALALEATAECGIPFVLLDRPNPIRGLFFDGPIRKPSLKSFVSWMPLPITHGLTIGELLSLAQGEGWLESAERTLEVVALENWHRSHWFDETGLRWIPPSPNMPRLATATLYGGTCLLEGTSISEGRGTDSPFELVGAPWADPVALLTRLERHAHPGVRFEQEEFTPREIPGVAPHPKYLGRRCRGIRIHIVDRDRVEPVRLGISILSAFKRSHPGETDLNNRRFDILAGTPEVRTMINRGADPEDIIGIWKEELEAFGTIRSRYLLYQ